MERTPTDMVDIEAGHVYIFTVKALGAIFTFVTGFMKARPLVSKIRASPFLYAF